MVHPTHYPLEMPDPPVAPMNCPRCDRTYDLPKVNAQETLASVTARVLALVKEHVREQHPDHDPDWADDA